jgi:hypothetical protein
MNVQRSCVISRTSWANTTYNNCEGSKLHQYAVRPIMKDCFVYHRPEANCSVKGMAFLSRYVHKRAKKAY